MTDLLKIAALLIVGGAILSIKAAMLVLVLGWFGITAIGFWKAVVAVVLLDLLLGAVCRK
jgi:hypothetical protein